MAWAMNFYLLCLCFDLFCKSQASLGSSQIRRSFKDFSTPAWFLFYHSKVLPNNPLEERNNRLIKSAFFFLCYSIIIWKFQAHKYYFNNFACVLNTDATKYIIWLYQYECECTLLLFRWLHPVVFLWQYYSIENHMSSDIAGELLSFPTLIFFTWFCRMGTFIPQLDVRNPGL